MTGKIVVGYDASPSAKRALDFALNAALANGSGLIVAHVLEWSPYTFLTKEEIEERHARRNMELARAEEAILKPAVTGLGAKGVTVETVSRFGNIAEVLAKIARDQKAEQIIVGRTGHSGLTSRLFGSVAGSLAQAAPVAVTIVP